MDKKLKEVLSQMGIEGENFYINEDGEVKQKGILGDTDTGIYQDKDGVFKKKGILGDEDTKFYQNEQGEFKKKGLLGDEDTGIYEDEDGNFKKKGFLGDEKTGYYKDDDGAIKEESFFSRNKNSIGKIFPNGNDDTDTLIVKMFFLVLVIGIIGVFAMLFIMLCPVIFLVWYLISRREKTWTVIVASLSALYLTYDYGFQGFLTREVFHIYDGSTLGIGYFFLGMLALTLWADKIISNLTIKESGNFLETLPKQQRRWGVIGIGILLFMLLSYFMFFRFY